MRRHHPTKTSPAASGGASGYDWTRFGRHRLRAAASTVLDHPVSAGGWVATAVADPHQPGGWTRLTWQPAPTRGWLLPSRLALGDIVEFGHDQTQWWGIVDSYEPGGWLTVQGPYANPGDAAREAELLLAAERYLAPVEPERPRHANRSCSRRRQRPGRHP